MAGLVAVLEAVFALVTGALPAFGVALALDFAFPAGSAAGGLMVRALTFLLRRLLCRAALLRWVRPLLAMVSTSEDPKRRAAAAEAGSPASTALITFLMAVRMRERRATLC